MATIADVLQACENLGSNYKAMMARMDDLELKAGRRNLVSNAPGPVSYEHKAQTETFLKYVRRGEKALTPSEQKALVEDATGQYLVSPELDMEIQREVEKLVVIRQLAAKRTITKDRLRVRDISEASVGWGKLETGAMIPESTLTPGAPADKYAESITGLTKVGEDELADSDFNLQNIIVNSFARKIAQLEEAGFIRGAGHASEEPDGIILDSTLVSNTVTTEAAGAVTIEKMMEMIYEVPAIYRKAGSFVVHSKTELALRQLRAGGSTTTDGPFLWQPSLIEGKPPTFLGYPIYCCDELDDLSDAAGVIGIFGDFNAGYQIIDRKGITVQRLDELYSESGLVGFRLTFRVGGYVVKPSNKALVLLTEHSA